MYLRLCDHGNNTTIPAAGWIMSKGHCKLKNTSTDLPDCRISLWCCRKPIFRDRYLVYRTRTDQCKMPAAETSGELIHSFRQPPYWPWCHKYYLPRYIRPVAIYFNKVGEENLFDGLASIYVTIVSRSHIHCQLLSPAKPFRIRDV